MGQGFAEIGRLFGLAYSDAMRLIRRMWRAIAVILLALLVVGFVTGLIGTQIRTAIGQTVLDFVGSVAGIWLTAPYFVALYRFVLSDVVIRAESLRGTQASRLFFGWSATISFVLLIPSHVSALIDPSAQSSGVPADGPGLWVMLVLSIAIWVFVVRTITLLPSVADGRRPTLRQALAETRGHFWFIVGAEMAVALPLLLGCGVAMVLLIAVFLQLGVILSALVFLVMAVILTQVSISLSARLYQKFSGNTAAAMPAPPA